MSKKNFKKDDVQTTVNNINQILKQPQVQNFNNQNTELNLTKNKENVIKVIKKETSKKVDNKDITKIEKDNVKLTEINEKSKNKNSILNTNLENKNENIVTEEIAIEKNDETTTTTFYPLKAKNKYSTLEIFSLCLILFLIILFASFIIFTVTNIKNTKIIKGISILGVDISNQSKEAALQTIQNVISKNIPQEIKLKHNDYETSISTENLEINFDIESAVNEAFSIGRTGNILENNLEILKKYLQPIDILPNLTLNGEQLKTSLSDISTKLPDTVIQSSYYIENNNLILTKGKKGNVVNIDEMSNYIIESIKNLSVNNYLEIITKEQTPNKLDIDSIHNEIYKQPSDAYFTQEPYAVYASENGLDFAISIDEAKALLEKEQEEYTIPLKILYPNITTNMIGQEAFPDLLSQFSTSYSTRDKDRTTNLILASNKINGTVLMPGEIFSYNTVVGERTISAGYKEAPIYVSGEVVDGLGGGICQITTTLYNAVVYANLEIVERSNHQFIPSYSRESRDATVVYGSIDFKFKNNRDYPIKIICSVNNGIANFKILGLKTNNDYQVEITSRVTSQTANYINSEAYKILKKNGQTLSSSLLSRDTYKRH